MLYSAIYENKNVALLLMRISKLVREEYVCLCGMLGCCCGIVRRISKDYDVYEKNRGHKTARQENVNIRV